MAAAVPAVRASSTCAWCAVSARATARVHWDGRSVIGHAIIDAIATDLGQERRRDLVCGAPGGNRQGAEGQSAGPGNANHQPQGTRGARGAGQHKARQADGSPENPRDEIPEAASHPKGRGVVTNVAGDTRLGCAEEPPRRDAHYGQDDSLGFPPTRCRTWPWHRFETGSCEITQGGSRGGLLQRPPQIRRCPDLGGFRSWTPDSDSHLSGRVSSRTQTSTAHCAAAGRRAQALGFRRAVGCAATGTPSARPQRGRVQSLPPARP